MLAAKEARQWADSIRAEWEPEWSSQVFQTTCGWWELGLLERGEITRRRHIEDERTARQMVAVWLEFGPAAFDGQFGNLGLRP